MNPTSRIYRLFGIVLTAMLLASCQSRIVYSEFRELSSSGWHEDSVLHYVADITDSLAAYDILFTVRHNAQYPYQNLWLFVGEEMADGTMRYDTVECYLADDRGRWLGAGMRTYELPMLYESQHRFVRSGKHTFTLQQGMREESLRGITDIGLQIVEHHGEE